MRISTVFVAVRVLLYGYLALEAVTDVMSILESIKVWIMWPIGAIVDAVRSPDNPGLLSGIVIIVLADGSSRWWRQPVERVWASLRSVRSRKRPSALRRWFLRRIRWEARIRAADDVKRHGLAFHDLRKDIIRHADKAMSESEKSLQLVQVPLSLGISIVDMALWLQKRRIRHPELPNPNFTPSQIGTWLSFLGDLAEVAFDKNLSDREVIRRALVIERNRLARRRSRSTDEPSN